MPDGPTVFAMFCAFYAVIAIARYVWIRTRVNRHEQWAALHAPLVPSSANIRLDAALRDAQDGFTVCSLCSFENIKRRLFCALCGASIRSDIVGASKQALRSVADKVHIRGHRHNDPRTRRARLRREWIRRIDVSGAMFWYRDSIQGHPPGGATSHMPSVVLSFVPSDGTDDFKATSTESLGGSEQGETNTLTLLSLNDALRREYGVHRLELIDAAKADAAVAAIAFPDHETTPALEQMRRDLVRQANLPFPSKIAEFVARTTGLLVPATQQRLEFMIRRGDVLHTSLRLLACATAPMARSVIRVRFEDERGIDAGGVYQEWFTLLTEKLVEPTAGLFTCVNQQEKAYYFNPSSKLVTSDDHLTYFFATGRFIGRSLLEGNPTGFHLALPLLKIILGQPVTFSDLEFFDPDAYKNMLWLLENDHVDTLGLDFSVTERVAGSNEVVTVDLVPNGRNMDVTDANKHEYVVRKFKYLVFESVSEQLYAFLKGLYEVIPLEMLMLFDPEELDYVLSGSDEIDVDDWERNTKFTADLIDHPVRKWFWEIVREMPNEYRRRLLQFTTGSSRVPLAGFSALTSHDGQLCPFNLKGVSVNKRMGYVWSHACFNRLDLPRHRSKRHLRSMLESVLADSDMYGFTTE